MLLPLAVRRRSLCVRLKDVELASAYHAFGDNPTANDIRPLLNTVLEQFTEKNG